MGRDSLSLTAKMVCRIMEPSLSREMEKLFWSSTAGRSGKSSGSVARMLNLLMPQVMFTI